MKGGNSGKIILLSILLLVSIAPVQSIDNQNDLSSSTTYLDLDQTDSIIDNILINPTEPTINENITVQADVEDADILSEVLLFWKYDFFNTSYNNVSMNLEEISATGGTFEGVIPGLPEPSFVSYYIQANDSLGNIIESEINSFLINSKPSISSYSIPHLIYPDNNTIPVNVTVNDPDGYESIGSDGVVFQYRLLGDAIWTSSNLVFSRNISLTESIYTGNITYNPPLPVESFLEISLNVTDTVGGMVGYSDSTTDGIIVDFKGPTLTSIDLIDLTDPNINATGYLDSLVMEAEFADFYGVSNVSIFYRINNDSQFVEIPMLNMSDISIDDNVEVFNISLPAANEDALVYYYFGTKDFLNNTHTTPLNYYHADGLGPVVYDNDIFFKSVISNSSQATILFNSTEASGVNETGSLLFYRLDNINDSIWYNTPISPINYNSIIDYQQTFEAQDLPVFIRDGEFTNLTIEVNRQSIIQQALLTIEFTHELSSDLRMWLKTSSGEILIFDRVTDVDTIDLNLFELGFLQSDFDDNNFTLVIQDFNDDYSGTIDTFEIELINYELAFPYQYSASINPTINDTRVSFYIGMYDIFENMVNSSTMSYYADGASPEVSLVSVSAELDLGGAHYIPIEAIVTDTGGLENVELYYQVDNSSWIIKQMYLDAETGYYRHDLIPGKSTGEISYYVRAHDLVGYQAHSNLSTFSFLNAMAPVISVYGDPFGIDALDMEDTNILPILANVTDNGVIVSITLYYKFDMADEWLNITMNKMNDSHTYFAEIELPDKEGKVFFKIEAIDDENLVTVTQDFTIIYENAGSSSLLTYLMWGGGAIGVAFIAFILYKFIFGKGTAVFSRFKRPG